MTAVLIVLAIVVALFEIARSEIDSAGAPMPERRKLDDDEPHIR